MKNLRTIIVVGFVFPFALMMLFTSVLITGWQGFTKIRDSRETTYAAFKRNREMIVRIAPKLPALQNDVANITAMVANDQSTDVANAFKGIESKVDPVEAKRTVYNKLNEGGVIPGVSIPSDALSIEWMGKYSTLQMILLQAESIKPNLFLAELAIEATPKRTVTLTQRYQAFRADIATPTQ